MRLRRPGVYDIAAPIPYPGSRLKCDLGMGNPTHWAIEVKMARAFGDNGKLDDTYVKDLLSPYASDHSALMDIAKLRASGGIRRVQSGYEERSHSSRMATWEAPTSSIQETSITEPWAACW